MRKRGAVKVREVLVLGDVVGKRCGKVYSYRDWETRTLLEKIELQ